MERRSWSDGETPLVSFRSVITTDHLKVSCCPTCQDPPSLEQMRKLERRIKKEEAREEEQDELQQERIEKERQLRMEERILEIRKRRLRRATQENESKIAVRFVYHILCMMLCLISFELIMKTVRGTILELIVTTVRGKFGQDLLAHHNFDFEATGACAL
jgi:hypothetical protein